MSLSIDDGPVHMPCIRCGITETPMLLLLEAHYLLGARCGIAAPPPMTWGMVLGKLLNHVAGYSFSLGHSGAGQ